MDFFKTLCKKCGGKCCRTWVFVNSKEFQELQHVKHFRIERKGAGYMLYHDRECPFLTKDGCSIPDSKPLDCISYPLRFLYNKGKTEFYEGEDCPFLNKIPKKWLLETEKLTRNELKKWTKKEIESFCKIIKSQDKLIPV